MERIDANDAVRDLSDIGWAGDKEGRECLPFSQNEDMAVAKFIEFGNQLREQAEAKNLKVSIKEDPFGNAYITLEGAEAKKYMVCSHIDSVYNGGRYDGIAGLAVGLEAMQKLIDDDAQLNYSLTVAAFRGEESSATNRACLGSALATGRITVENLKNLKHKSFPGKTLLEVIMEKRGLTEAQISTALRSPFINPRYLKGGIEVHIEQSGVLEHEGESLAVVTEGIGSARRSVIEISPEGDHINYASGTPVSIIIDGFADHSGGTPMNGEEINSRVVSLRKDALAIAAKVLKTIKRKNIAFIKTPGGSVNTIPGKCVIECVAEEERIDDLLDVLHSHDPNGDFITCYVETEPADLVKCIREEVACAALGIIEGVEEAAEMHAYLTRGKTRATVGNIEQKENGSLSLALDLRKLNTECGAELQKDIETVFVAGQEKYGARITETVTADREPVKFQGDIQAVITKQYRRLFKDEPVTIGSMPGHDLSNIIPADQPARTAIPAGMIFIRSLNGGVSHNPAESTSEEDISKAAELLYAVLTELCA